MNVKKRSFLNFPLGKNKIIFGLIIVLIFGSMFLVNAKDLNKEFRKNLRKALLDELKTPENRKLELNVTKDLIEFYLAGYDLNTDIDWDKIPGGQNSNQDIASLVSRLFTVYNATECLTGWKCKTSSEKAYQNADCSWSSITSCGYGCFEGGCREGEEPVAVNNPPILNSIGNKMVDEGQLLSFTISATDPDGDALTYSVQNLPAGAVFLADGFFSWMPDQAGTYTPTFTVSDGSLTDSETITITVSEIGISFYGFEQPLNNKWKMAGDAEIVSDNPQSGQYYLKLGAMGRAVLPVSDNNVYGKVSFWVKDSMTEFPASDGPSVGPIFGLQNKDGDMLLFGILRRDFVSGTKYQHLFTAESNFYALRNLGAWPYVDRTGEWQKWTIELSGPGVINVYVNDELKIVSDSLKQYFSKGFTGVYFRGDDSVGPEDFLFDEVTVEVSGDGQIDVHEFPEPRAITNVLQDPNFFPISVWAQPLVFMDYFKGLGVNIFIGEILQFGPTTQEEFLDGLYSKGLYGIIFPAEVQEEVDPEIISQLKGHPALLAWRQRDEPDVKSSIKPGPKSTPEEIKVLYDEIGALDSEHSVYVNFGTSPADPTQRYMKTTDYYEYCEGADIISYDIYPVSNYPNGEKLLYSVADGIDNLKKCSDDKKSIWIWLEVGERDEELNRAPTPQEMRAEVWMTIIHGADGIGWFAQEFDPFSWHDIPPELEVEMTNIAQTLQSLAPVIKSLERDDVGVEMLTQGRIDVSSRINDNKLYFFTVNMMNKEVDAEFILPSQYSSSRFQVINEGRTVQASQARFSESFSPFEVHLYEEIN